MIAGVLGVPLLLALQRLDPRVQIGQAREQPAENLAKAFRIPLRHRRQLVRQVFGQSVGFEVHRESINGGCPGMAMSESDPAMYAGPSLPSRLLGWHPVGELHRGTCTLHQTALWIYSVAAAVIEITGSPPLACSMRKSEAMKSRIDDVVTGLVLVVSLGPTFAALAWHAMQ